MTIDSRQITLGNRIKRYERAYDHALTPRSCLLVRVDGRAFHTYTRGCVRPFDPGIMDVMVYATQRTAEDMQGFKLAYVQSDEATFLLTDFDTFETQGWFGYRLNKVVSIAASLFTAWFGREHDNGRVATFDARAFVVPADDAPNVFIWRQRDWERNSIQMLAQAHFSHRELQGKGHAELHELLHAKGLNWADLSDREKNGTFVLRDGSEIYLKLGYETIANLIAVEEVES